MAYARTTRIKRVSLDEPGELATLIRSGAIWRFPILAYWQIAIDAIEDGLVPLSECRDMPYRVAELLARPRSA